MKKLCFATGVIFGFFCFISTSYSQTVLIDDVPAYQWYHGCGPTAAASIIGYYDLHGYDSLFDASGWDDVRQTNNVQDHISSPEHNAHFNPDPDLPGPEPPDTSIADFFKTSENKPYGWSNLSNADDAFEGYAAYRGYNDWISWSEFMGDFTWDSFTDEIDNNRLMMFLVDTDADGLSDHFVPVFGYDDITNQYACYTTWSEDESDISWYNFTQAGNPWGVVAATYIFPGAKDPVPEPSTLLLMALGVMALSGVRGKRK